MSDFVMPPIYERYNRLLPLAKQMIDDSLCVGNDESAFDFVLRHQMSREQWDTIANLFWTTEPEHIIKMFPVMSDDAQEVVRVFIDVNLDGLCNIFEDEPDFEGSIAQVRQFRALLGERKAEPSGMKKFSVSPSQGGDANHLVTKGGGKPKPNSPPWFL